MKIFTVLKKRALLVALIAFLAANVVQAQTYPVYVTDQTPTTPLVNPKSSSFQPRYISGFGMDDAFKVFFEDRDNSNTISFNSTTTGPEGFSAGNTETNIAPETHFCVKDWPININGTDYDYRAWGSVGNNANHRFYVSNDLLNWTLVSTFTISNATSFTNSRGWVYYGFHDVILINGTYYAFAESNQSQTMICKSTQADDNWEAIAAVGGTQAGDGPLQLPAGVTYGWTPSGNFFNLGDDVGYGKVYCDPRDSDFYLAINTEAKSSLEPAQFEAAFINPANWNWHDGTTGAANAPILSETSEHDLRECWLVPNSESFDEWNIIYDADYGSSDGGKALGYATLAPITEVWVDDDFDNTDPGWQVVRFDNITDAIDAVSEGTTITVLDGTYNENLLIDKNLTLVSENGKDVTTIEGVSGVGSLGTIQITNATDGLQIGAENQGFTIIGIDNGNPGLENAAVYFQGNGHTNATIQYNEIQANGDAALMAEYNRDITYFDINNNTFSGKTFVGPNPAGDGFSQQFTLPNVPRQLVVFGGGGGGTNTYHINFTDNQVTGIAGGYNTSGNEQGNTLVTIDADNSVITGNTFNGTTTRYGASLRSRRLNTTISGNTFSSANLTPTCSQLYVQNKALDAALIVANTFDKGVYVEDPNGGSVGLLIQGYIDGASIGDVINLLAGTYNEDLQFDKSVNLHGAGPDATILTNRMRLGGNLEDITLKDFRIERDEAPLMSAEYLNPVFDGVTFDNVKFILNGESTNPNVGGRRALTFGFGFPTAVEGDGLLFQDVTMQATDPDEVAAFMILQSSGGGPVTFDNITIIGSGSYNSINTFGNTDVITVTNSNAENGGSFYLSGLNEISVTNNTFSGDGGVFVNGVNSAEISDNFFENKSINGYPAISFSAAWGPTQNYSVNFVNNIFNNIDNKGIRIYNYTAEDPDNDFLTATNNDFSGVSGLVIDNQYPEHTLVTATCNWWGTTDPQTIGGLISEGVQASPFLVSDDLDNPDCSGVGPVENITQGLTHFTIQEAINAANANDEIEVNAGTYQENLEIDVEGLTLTAVGDVTIQDVDDPEDPLWPTPNGEPSGHRVPVIHIGANNVTIDGFKVRDFDIVTYVFPVLWVNADGVTVQNMDFYTDEAYPGWQQPNEIRIEGNNATIQGNTILRDHDYQNGHPAITLGVAPQYPLASNSQVGDVVIENNSITGGPIGGDVLDNATVELINNTIDGAWQEGIWFYPVAATADLIITGNTVQNHDKAALGSKGLKVVSKPATINAQTHTNDMLDALIADNPNVPSFLLQWVKDVHNVTQDLFYDNIQPAIDAANASDVIEVAAGTYNEQVTIDKALTLNGAQADVDPVSGGRSGGESTIQCDYDISPHAMIILADNVTVNGFEFIETYTSIDVRTDVDVTRQNVSLKYHYINSDAAWVGVGVGQDLDAGPKSTGEGFFDNIEVNNTLFEVSAVNNTHNDYVNAAINLTSGFTDFVTYSNLIITDNDVANEGSYGIFAGGNPNDFLVDGVTISDNHIHDCSTGINVYNLKDLTFDGNIIEDITYTGAQINIRTGSVTNNTFQNIGPSPYWPYNGDYYPSTGLKLWGDQYGPVGSHDATITNNTFNYNNFDPEEEYAARVLDGCDASTISFNSNAFINGNAVADILAIKNYVAGQTLEATCNWWDTTDPYEIDELTEGDILFLPFWTSETGPCDGIGPVVNTTQDISYMTIQAAIDAADHGDDIEV
ncbi:MAG: right-handed parallel beta-helix repeat-containing protein, partial [Bacteroidales bacterium]|nr:right-handed parallel beta-helix repeat-containing protein [Bacteroidales bacterium]